jgi:hypothetical protein
MEATKENSTEKYYLNLGTIEGFEYVEGLKVLITPIKNPPMEELSRRLNYRKYCSGEKIIETA